MGLDYLLAQLYYFGPGVILNQSVKQMLVKPCDPAIPASVPGEGTVSDSQPHLPSACTDRQKESSVRRVSEGGGNSFELWG